jgi:hypothetical protein
MLVSNKIYDTILPLLLLVYHLNVIVKFLSSQNEKRNFCIFAFISLVKINELAHSAEQKQTMSFSEGFLFFVQPCHFKD